MIKPAINDAGFYFLINHCGSKKVPGDTGKTSIGCVIRENQRFAERCIQATRRIISVTMVLPVCSIRPSMVRKRFAALNMSFQEKAVIQATVNNYH